MRLSQTQNNGTIWTYDFLSVCLINAFMNLSKQMSNSILSKYVDSLGEAATMVGLVSSVFALAALIFKLVSGPALDTGNKKHIIIGAMTALGIAFAGYSISSNVPMIVVFRFLQGAAQAFTATCLLTMASDVLPANKFSTGVGVFALFESVAQAIGPTVGLALVEIVGYQFTFAISSALMLGSAFVLLFYKQPQFTRKGKFRFSFKSVLAKEVILFSILLLVFNLISCVVNTYLVIFAAEQGITENVGLYFTVYACAMLFSRPFIGKLTDRFGVVKVLIPAFGCVVIAYWMISGATHIWMLLLAALISAFGLGACQPAVQALCMKCVPKERRGAASSTCYIAQDLGNLVGPLVAAFLVEQFGYVFMWRAMTLPIVAAVFFLLFTRRKIRDVETSFVSKA